MMTAICAFAIHVLYYTFHIIKGTKTDLQRLDKKTQKLLTINSMPQQKSSAARLYLHRLKDGWGLAGVDDTHREECSALAKYVMQSDHTLKQIVPDTPSPMQKHIMQYVSASHHHTLDLTDADLHKMLH
eukprot:4682425-Ditylum_brightwellii.AAC.1